MLYPELLRENEVLAAAVERRAHACEGYRRLVGMAMAAAGTPCAAQAAGLRDAAPARLASSGARVRRAEHGA